MKKELTTITTFSKTLATGLFILMPFVGFYIGVKYQKSVTVGCDNDFTHLIAFKPVKTQSPTATVKVLGMEINLPNNWQILSTSKNGVVISTSAETTSPKISLDVKQLTKTEVKKIATKQYGTTPINNGMIAHNNCASPAECHIISMQNKVFLLSWTVNNINKTSKVNTKLSFSTDLKDSLWKVAQTAKLVN